jgi:tetratricopeptide (TPR) repeat protein
VDVLLEALALRLTDGYAAAAPTLTRALELGLALDVADDEVDRWRWLATGRASAIVALELWDAEASHALAAAQAQLARDTGAPVYLQYALNTLASSHLLAGELTTAARLVEEDRLIAEVTGNPPAGYAAMMLWAWRGQERAASERIEATVRVAAARGQGRTVHMAAYASSVLYNGLGRHDLAREAAWRAFARDELGYGPLVVPELAEAASRTGDVALVRAALDWLSERTRLTSSEWALGIEARLRALLSQGDAAEDLYRESIDRLGRTRVRVQLARAHLLYGEWLRRQRRRIDAREQLRTAHDLLTATACRTRRSAAGCSSAHARSSTPAQGVHQAGHQLPRPARPGPAQRSDHHPAGLAAGQCGSLVGALPGQRLASRTVHWRMRAQPGANETRWMTRRSGRVQLPPVAAGPSRRTSGNWLPARTPV